MPQCAALECLRHTFSFHLIVITKEVLPLNVPGYVMVLTEYPRKTIHRGSFLGLTNLIL